MSKFAAVLAVIFCLTAVAGAEPVTPPKPVPAEVYLKSGGENAGVTGTLVSYDDDTFIIRVDNDERTIAWRDITPASAFTLRQKLIDRTIPEEWLALGKFAWSMGAKEEAEGALRTAVRMRAGLRKQVDEVFASKLGGAASSDTPTTKPASGAKPAGDAKPDGGAKPARGAKPDDGELIRKAGDDTPDPQPPGKNGEKVERVKYAPATPAQAEAAMKKARDQSQKTQAQLGIKLTEIETDHFLILTDWDPREYNFLKRNLEDAYRVVSKQFEMSPKDNIFVGKLAVYMFVKKEDFYRFAKEVDSYTEIGPRVAGYYRGYSNGMGHMAMWKPDPSLTGFGSAYTPERQWGKTLIHEFTHAFVARYRSNARVPRWLNEGIAEVIAYGEIQLSNRRVQARDAANEHMDISAVFNDAVAPSGKYYPVMQTMVEMLVQADRKKFLKLFDAIKDGTEPEEALKSIYKIDYQGLTREWYDYAKKIKH